MEPDCTHSVTAIDRLNLGYNVDTLAEVVCILCGKRVEKSLRLRINNDEDGTAKNAQDIGVAYTINSPADLGREAWKTRARKALGR